MHVLDPGTDCIGARFELAKEYVVFAIEQPAKDYRLGDDFWYGWLDVLRADAKILTVDNYCDSTGEISKSRDTLAKLGPGKQVR